MLLRASKFLEHISRIRTEYLLNNTSTGTEHIIEQWITEQIALNEIEQKITGTSNDYTVGGLETETLCKKEFKNKKKQIYFQQ